MDFIGGKQPKELLEYNDALVSWVLWTGLVKVILVSY